MMSDDAEAAAVLQASAASYAAAWRGHFAREHDPSALLGEDNVFRYRPCRGIIARGDASPPRSGSRSCSLCSPRSPPTCL